MTDFDLRKLIAGEGSTIYECDSNLNSGRTDYEILKSLYGGATKYEATINAARALGLLGKYSTRFEADYAIYNSMDLPIPYYKLNEDISTLDEFNRLPWGKSIKVIELKRPMEANKWYTVAFPFTCKRSDFNLPQESLSICRIISLNGSPDDGAHYTSQLVSDNEDIIANYPYQVYTLNGAVPTLIANNVLFTEDMELTSKVFLNKNWYFIANFLKRMYGVGEYKHFAFNNGTDIRWIPTTGMEIKAYSGVFEVNTETITDGWKNTIDKTCSVIVDGDITLENGTFDCYSLEFTNRGHLTIKNNSTLRVWEGGVVNSDADTTEYFTLWEDTLNNIYSNLLFHPSVNVNYAIETKRVNTTYFTATSWAFQRIGIIGTNPHNFIAHYNNTEINFRFYKYNKQSTASSKWEVIGDSRLNPTALKYNEMRPFTVLNSAAYDTERQNQPGNILTLHSNMTTQNFTSTLSKSGAEAYVDYIANGWTGIIQIKDLHNYLKTISSQLSLWYKPYGASDFIELTDSNVDNYRNQVLYPTTGDFIVEYNGNSSIQYTLSYEDLIWNKSFN